MPAGRRKALQKKRTVRHPSHVEGIWLLVRDFFFHITLEDLTEGRFPLSDWFSFVTYTVSAYHLLASVQFLKTESNQYRVLTHGKEPLDRLFNRMALYSSIWSFTFIISFQDYFRILPDCFDPLFCFHLLSRPGKDLQFCFSSAFSSSDPVISSADIRIVPNHD